MGLVTGGLAALGAALSIGSFSSMLQGTIAAQAHLQDLADKVGTTVSSLSQLSPAAKLSGTSMDEVAQMSGKFSKSLAAVIEGNDKATAAFKAFGFSAEDAAKFLDDPVKGLQELAKSFDRALPDGNRTAAMLELLGKGAQGAAPFLKQLAEMGELHTTVTNEQAAAAKRLEDQWTIMRSAGNSLKNELASFVAEALAPMIEKFNLARQAGAEWGEAVASASRNGKEEQARIQELKAQYDALIVTVSRLQDQQKNEHGPGLTSAQLAQLTLTEGKLADVERAYRSLIKARDDLIFAELKGTYFGDAQDQRLGNMAASLSKVKIGFEDAAKGVDTFTPAMDAARKSLVDAQIALDDVGKTADEKTTPAMKALKEMQASSVWEGWNTTQRNAYTAEMNRVSSLQALNATLQANFKLEDDLDALIGQIEPKAIGFTQEWTKQFGLLTAAHNADLITLERFQELTAALLEQQPFEKARQAAADAYVKSLEEAIKKQEKLQADAQVGLANYTQQNQLMERELQLIGLDEVARAKAIVAMDAEKERQKLINAGMEELLPALDREVARRQEIVAQQILLNREMDGWKQLWSDVADRGASFITDFVQHGSSAFKNLWNDFKTWALEAIAKIAAQQIVLSIAPNFGGVSGAAASSLFGNSGGFLSNLLGSSSNSSAAGPVQPTGILGSVGSMLGGSLGAFGAGLTSPISTIGSAITGGIGAVGGIAGILGAAVPIIGGLFAAGSLFGLFGNNSPAQREGTFGSNAGLQPGNPLFQSSSNLGTFGIFNDKWFSDKDQGQAIQQFLAGITQVDNAIASIIDEPTLARVKANLATATTTFTAGMEHEASTFGDVIKDRYHNVVETIDPELTHLIDGFKGTSDQLGKFVVDILAVHETLKTFNSEDLFGQIVTVDDIVTLQRAGESVSQTFTRISQEFTLTNAIAATMGQNVSTAFGEMGLASEGARADLIKLMGGMQAAGAAFTNYLNVAFTDAERQAKSTAAATKRSLPCSVASMWQFPKRGTQLNALISSLDLTTAEGRQAYATMMNEVVPAFVAVHGTAQSAAGAVHSQATATTQVATAAASVINPMMGVVQGFTQLRSAASLANDALSGISSQNDALEQFMGGSDNGTKLGNRLSVITGEIASFEDQLARYQGGDLSTSDNAFGEIATLMKTIAPLKQAQKDVADALGHFAVLSAQYGPEIANKLYDLEQNYNKATGTLANNSAALGILKTSFDSQWASIVGGAKDATAVLIDATQSVVDHVMTPLETAISGLHSAFGNDTALTDAVKWLNGVSVSSARSDDWQVNLNNALPDGKLMSQADAAAMTRVIGQLLEKISQNTEKTTTADAAPQATGSRVTA
jgi:hypothetical protein